MNRLIIILTTLLSFLICKAGLSSEQKVLLETDSSWEGKTISLSKRKIETVSVLITLSPGEALPFHCHPLPTLAYVVSGELEIEKMDGKKFPIKKGESFLEVVNTWHRGHNLSKTKPVELLVFYIGSKNHEDTLILYDEMNKNKCSS